MLIASKRAQFRASVIVIAASALTVILNAVICPAAGAQTAAPGIVGLWYDHTNRGAVELMPCGDRLCGYIAWLADPLGKDGKPLVDRHNPVQKRRNGLLCGTRIISNLAEVRGSSGRSWENGQIYDPEKGESYDLKITMPLPDRLQVLGYAGLEFLGETFTWTRAPADLDRCGPPHD
jgi:uncharacterized protein (DUF2147 family)